MTVPSFLTNLIVPLNLCVTCLILAMLLWIFRQRKKGLALAVAGVAWALFWSLPATSLWAGGRLEQMYPHAPPSQLPVAQAIVVLGGNTANNRKNWFEPYNENTATSRVDTAYQLYEAGRAPLIVLSGAALDGSTSEAQTMANTLEDDGISKEHLLLETRSLNTHQNGMYTAALLKARHISRVLLVTSALHMPRALAVFKKQGLQIIPAPSASQIFVPGRPGFSFWLPDWRTITASRSIIKEYAGLLVYWLRGWV